LIREVLSLPSSDFPAIIFSCSEKISRIKEEKKGKKESFGRFKIYDFLGRKILETNKPLDTSRLKKGIYFIFYQNLWRKIVVD
ncbi:MAG: hypothetical protein ABIK76_02645, partial [candidate division WOR-3 bacterium]